MSEYIHLQGAESVKTAASTIRSAADEISRAAGHFNDTVQDLKVFMEDWLVRLEEVMRERSKA